jgi:exopolysaccharide biosynthesis polyprenyl glycosylphosphotransferase
LDRSGESHSSTVQQLPRVNGEHSRSLGWLTPVIVVADALCINVAFYLAYALRYQAEWPYPVEDVFYAPYRLYFPVGVLLSALLLVVFRIEGLYSDNAGETWFDEVYRLVNGTTTGIVIAVVFYFFYRPVVYSRLVFFYAAVLIVLLLAMVRWVKHMGLDYLRRRGIGVARVLIVGAGEVGRAVIRSIVAHPELGYQIVGFVDDDPEDGGNDLGRIRCLGPTSRVASLVRDGSIDQVIVTLPWVYHRQILAIMGECQSLDVEARVVPDIFQMSLNRVDVQQLDGIPLLGLREPRISGLNRAAKRAVDVVAGLVGVLGMALIYVPVAIAIKLDSPGPVLYSQERVGRHGKRFMIYKFRSMCDGADEQQRELLDKNEADGPLFKIRDDPRSTRVGKLLRRMSLDEWPQFINVLRGDMSLIGPRPNRPAEVEEYKQWQRRRLDVKPGMTGLWQVSGRSDVPFDEMVLLDIYYIDNWSFYLDAKIAVRTVLLPILGRGAY